MRVGVLGSGQVGRTVSAGLVKAGHDVVLGTRDASRGELVDYANAAGVRWAPRTSTFAWSAALASAGGPRA